MTDLRIPVEGGGEIEISYCHCEANEAAIRANERAEVLEEVAKALEAKADRFGEQQAYEEFAVCAALSVQIRKGIFPPPAAPSTEEKEVKGGDE